MALFIEGLLRDTLQPGRYLEPAAGLKPRQGYRVYKLFDRKRNPLQYVFIPDHFGFMVVPLKTNKSRFRISRAAILAQRKNNKIKSTYKRLRAANLLSNDSNGGREVPGGELSL